MKCTSLRACFETTPVGGVLTGDPLIIPLQSNLKKASQVHLKSKADIRCVFETALRSICDLRTTDIAAKADQERRIAENGGADFIRQVGPQIKFTRAPMEFRIG